MVPVDVMKRTEGDRTRSSQEVRRSEVLQVVFVTPEEVFSPETPILLALLQASLSSA